MSTVLSEWNRVALLLGMTVETPDGTGTLISVETPSNGLYVEWYRAMGTVWYGTDNSQNGWGQRVYALSEIKRTPTI